MYFVKGEAMNYTPGQYTEHKQASSYDGKRNVKISHGKYV